MTKVKMNIKREFDQLQREELGKYVYVLRDPRDGKIFYVGQGTDNRVFQHFNEAEECLNKLTPFTKMTSKVIRILDIWNNEENVEWLIIAHKLSDNHSASIIESAIYDSLAESQNGEVLNQIDTPKSSRLLPEDLEAMSAEFVNPNLALENVFIFPIQTALANGRDPYNATRSFWNISNPFRSLNSTYAVGLKNSISKGSYRVLEWVPVTGEKNKFEFTAEGHPAPLPFAELHNKNWNNVLSVAKGYWQRGNYLIVEFDGKGKFRVKRGSKDQTNWYDCI